jgi:hypothetical protein
VVGQSKKSFAREDRSGRPLDAIDRREDASDGGAKPTVVNPSDVLGGWDSAANDLEGQLTDSDGRNVGFTRQTTFELVQMKLKDR